MFNLFITTCTVQDTITAPTLGVVTTAALLDSINPCAIAVLLILLATLLMAQKKDRILKAGLSFIAGLFIAYFLLGIGLFKTLQLFQYAQIFHIIVGCFAILFGLYELKTAIWPSKQAAKVCIGGICAEDAFSVKIISKITGPFTAFIAGLIISIIELPCTGGPYIFTLGYLAQNCSWNIIIPILLYYNLIFILPLLVITLVIYFGYASLDKTKKLKDKYLRYINFATGFVMIALGLWLII